MGGEIERMTSTGHIGNAKTYVTAIRSLVKFAGRDKIDISEIMVKFMQDWIEWIGKQPTVTRGYVKRNYLSIIRAIHSTGLRGSLTMRTLALSESQPLLSLTLTFPSCL